MAIRRVKRGAREKVPNEGTPKLEVKLHEPGVEAEDEAEGRKSPETGAFKRLYALGKEKLDIVNAMLLGGDAIPSVATFIRDEWGEYTDVSHNAVVKQLSRYKDTELSVKKKGGLISADRAALYDKAILKNLEDRVDAVEVLNELITVQRKRILNVVAREEKVGLPFSWLTKDVLALKDLVQMMVNLEFDMGLRFRMQRDAAVHLVPHQGPGQYQDYVKENAIMSEINTLIRGTVSLLEGEYQQVDSD